MDSKLQMIYIDKLHNNNNNNKLNKQLIVLS